VVDELRCLGGGGSGGEVRSGESSIHTRTVGKQLQKREKREREEGKDNIFVVGLCIFGEKRGRLYTVVRAAWFRRVET
jgi:hypothetical protein